MGHETSLVPNFTFFIQLGVFVTCYLVLRFFVFNPYVRLVRLREERTTGLKAKAAELNERAKKYQVDYEAFMREERKKLAAWIEEQRQQISGEEREVLQAARERVGADLERLRKEIQGQLNKARGELLAEVSDYSSSIASKLLGHPVKVPAGAAYHAEAEAEQAI